MIPFNATFNMIVPSYMQGWIKSWRQKMKKLLVVLAALMLLGTAGISMAQDANGKNPKMSPKARLARQHKRIMNGVKSGKISKAQHKQLAQEGKDINQERKADKAANGGQLTKSQRQNLESQENLRSEQIYQDKHSNTGTGVQTGSSSAGTDAQSGPSGR
jgi:hypothetical protein